MREDLAKLTAVTKISNMREIYAVPLNEKGYNNLFIKSSF